MGSFKVPHQTNKCGCFWKTDRTGHCPQKTASGWLCALKGQVDLSSKSRTVLGRIFLSMCLNLGAHAKRRAGSLSHTPRGKTFEASGPRDVIWKHSVNQKDHRSKVH